MDGELVEWRGEDPRVTTRDTGSGAFEGVQRHNTVNGTAIFRLTDTERLFNSAKILRMKIPFRSRMRRNSRRAEKLELLPAPAAGSAPRSSASAPRATLCT